MTYDAIVIGGSAAGLAACLTLGRGLCNVLCIDLNLPCNRYADESHNFITNDGKTPLDIRQAAKAQVQAYQTVSFLEDKVTKLSRNGDVFSIQTAKRGGDNALQAHRVIIATGVTDQIDKLGIANIEQFWGNSIIHCPYCHGYEYAGKKTGLYFENPTFLTAMLPVIRTWSKTLHVFTPPLVLRALDNGFVEAAKLKGVEFVEGKIKEAQGTGAQILNVVLDNGSKVALDVLYTLPPPLLNLDFAEGLGIELQGGYVKVNEVQKTSVDGVFACGDCTSRMRSIARANGQGNVAGTMVSHELASLAWNNKI